jgi:hypothetical protein
VPEAILGKEFDGILVVDGWSAYDVLACRKGRCHAHILRRFRMEFPDRHVWLEEGEFLVVPRGNEHRPVAEEETHVLLFEPASTLNTGNVQNERTVAELERI